MSVSVWGGGGGGGIKMVSRVDFFYINMKEFNFTKRIRGRKPNVGIGIITEKLTGR